MVHEAGGEVELKEKEHFDLAASKYDKNYGYLNSFTKYKINKKASQFTVFVKRRFGKKPHRMLEIGCGTGEYTKRICGVFSRSRIHAIDISDKILEVAKKKCKSYKNVSFLARSAYKTGFNSNSFDVVYGFYVLHHLDISRFKNELSRVLKPGGIALFYEPNILNPVVFLIKSSTYLKRAVGDSQDEWAINPIKIRRELSGFRILNISMSEFILPLGFFPSKLLKVLDKIFDKLKDVPFVRYLGGSVQIILQKR